MKSYFYFFKKYIIFLFIVALPLFSCGMNKNALTQKLTALTEVLNTLNFSLMPKFFIGIDTISLLESLVGKQQTEQWHKEKKLIIDTFIIFSIRGATAAPSDLIKHLINQLKQNNVPIPTYAKIDYYKVISKEQKTIIQLRTLYFLDQNKNPIENALTFTQGFIKNLKETATIINQPSPEALANLTDISILINATSQDQQILNQAIAKTKNKLFEIQFITMPLYE